MFSSLIHEKISSEIKTLVEQETKERIQNIDDQSLIQLLQIENEFIINHKKYQTSLNEKIIEAQSRLQSVLAEKGFITEADDEIF